MAYGNKKIYILQTKGLYNSGAMADVDDFYAHWQPYLSVAYIRFIFFLTKKKNNNNNLK